MSRQVLNLGPPATKAGPMQISLNSHLVEIFQGKSKPNATIPILNREKTIIKLIKSFIVATTIGLITTLAILPVWAKPPTDILVIANRIDDITTLDPAETFEFSGGDLSNNIYGRLVNFDHMNLKAGYKGDLAVNWTVSGDGRTIVFKMRSGVKFHSGNLVTAHDAEYSLRRAVLLNKTPSFILTQFGFNADNVKERIKATENGTLSITTDKKYAVSFILNCLTANIGGIVDSKVVKAHADKNDMGNAWLKTHTAGSGAYRLVKWKPNQSYTLQSNPDFYLGAPKMKRVIVRHIQESSTQRLLLEKGDIDVARNLSPVDVAGASKIKDIAIDTELRGRLVYFVMNQKNPTLSKPKVREALKYLADYKGMANSFLKGQYAVHQAFLPRTYLGAIDDKPYFLNVAKAKNLLAEAGHADGFEIEIAISQSRTDIAQSLQNTFALAGIKAKLSIGNSKQVLSRYRARDFQIIVGSWGPDYPDPHTNASTFAVNADNRDEASQSGVLAWRAAWHIPKMTLVTEAALIEKDREKRAELYRALQRDHQKRSPFAIMFQQTKQTGRRSEVKNFNIGAAVTSASYWLVTK